MDVERFPLGELLEDLRADVGAGFSITIDDYRSAIATVTHEGGASNVPRLASLLRALLVKRREQEKAFDSHFRRAADRYYLAEIRIHSDYAERQPAIYLHEPTMTAPGPDPVHPYAHLRPERTPLRRFRIRMSTALQRLWISISRWFGASFGRHQQAASATGAVEVRPAVFSEELTARRGNVAISPEYVPATGRQMQQALRLLRASRTHRTHTDDLDVAMTVRDVAARGFFAHPIYKVSRVPALSIAILVDSSTSMRAFQRQVDDLVAASTKTYATKVYHFINVPGVSYFRDSDLCREESTAFVEMHLSNALCFVVSDGGATNGRLDAGRVAISRRELEKLGSLCQRVVWMNPMPRRRWIETSAEAVAATVPMFDFSASELLKAVRALRAAGPNRQDRNRSVQATDRT